MNEKERIAGYLVRVISILHTEAGTQIHPHPCLHNKQKNEAELRGHRISLFSH